MTTFAKLGKIMASHPQLDFICIDVANGYAESFVAFVSRVRQAYPDKTIIAGNVVTGEMVEELLLSGADVVKVGIGPGSACTTRTKAGVGYPQLSAVIECADAAHGLGGRIISDGGCTCAGDVAKAFGGGADFVMLGGMFAGHDESGGQLVERERSAVQAVLRHEFQDRHGQTCRGSRRLPRFGRQNCRGPLSGPLAETVKDILGGVRSACTYVGAEALKELTKRTTFIRVQEQENRLFQ